MTDDVTAVLLQRLSLISRLLRTAVKMPFEFSPKDNFPDYTGYKCMVKNHLTLEVRRLNNMISVTQFLLPLADCKIIVLTFAISAVIT